MDVLPIVTTFLLITVGELGDKTQLAVISLSCKYKASYVFWGALVAFLAVDGVSALVGGPLLGFLPASVVQIISGAVFIFFGILPLFPRKEKETIPKMTSTKLPFFASFSMVALMELGDKTQLITIALAAEHPPVLVLIGVMMGFALLTGVAVLLGAKLVARLPMKWLKIGTSSLFVVLGALSIIGAVCGVSLF